VLGDPVPRGDHQVSKKVWRADDRLLKLVDAVLIKVHHSFILLVGSRLTPATSLLRAQA